MGSLELVARPQHRMDGRFSTPMSSLDDTSLDSMQTCKEATSNIGAIPTTTATSSNLDLRQTKGELFSKLVERQPHQMIVTTPSKTSSDDNLASSLRSSNDLSRPVGGSRKASSKDDLVDANRNGPAQSNDLGQQRELVTFSSIRSRWYTNEEVAGILTSFNSHPEWQTNELQVRPKSGAVFLYSREKVRYRQDGYCWKKRKNGRTTREDHMKLKVQGIECIYGCYVHSAILPTFHRRCYWLLENPDVVLVHYLNQPLDDKNKMILTFDSGVLEADTRRGWTNEEIVEEIGSVFGGISQIQHTLNINFPDTGRAIGDSHTARPLYCADASAAGLADLGEFPSNNNDNQQDDSDQMDMSSADEQILSHHEFSDGGYKVPDDGSSNQRAESQCEHLAEHVETRNAIKLQFKEETTERDEEQEEEEKQEEEEEEDGDDDDKMIVAINSTPCGLTCSRDKDNGDNNAEIKPEHDGRNQTSDAAATPSDAMGYGPSNVSDEAQLARNDLMPSKQSTVDYDLIDPRVVLIGDQDDCRNLLNNSKNFYESTTITSDREQTDRRQHQHEQHQHGQSPCSPVTQIYNKIVDDIETYVLPLEPDQFNPNHHHHHHHGAHMHQQDSGITLGALETMNDEVGMSSYQRGVDRDGCNQQFVSASTTSSHYDGCSHSQADQSLALAPCDLFKSCAIDEMSSVGGQLAHEPSDSIQRDGDMLLADYTDLPDSDVTPSQVNNDNALTNVDLLMAIQSTNDEQDPSGHDNQQLLINDPESLDLFSFKPSNLGAQKSQLDVKSTTSDTDTMNRLSPMIPTVPRCNSTDNALRSSFTNHHLEQYQHRASSHFLHQDPPLNSFSQYTSNHNEPNANCSATSTEPSNSTSCSASPSSSPLLTAPSATALGVASNGDSGGLLLNSYMKLPLQQRQNSEQKEPSNSVLNSLLPKALSLDGSELSSHSNRYNHGHHLQPHNLRTSPLIGSHGLTHSRVEHSLRGVYSPHQNHQNPLNHQLLSTTSSIYPSSCQQLPQHYYQRPSVPSISPDRYSFDSTAANKMLINGSQYRSGSMVAASLSLSHQQYAQQQQQQATVECRRLRQPLLTHPRALPVLDYVPNWAPTSGGAKVLLIGNWTSLIDSRLKTIDDVNGNSMSSACLDSGAFSVLFGDLLVPAGLVQSNVIRFFSPQHEPGFIPVKVLYKDQVVSEQVLFEITTSTESRAAAHNDNQETYIFAQSGEHKGAQADELGNQSIGQAMDSTCITR